ncbi:MAG: aldo/keto reductase [Kiritimatiellae bacterium]|jgi:predicted aldo/keto reductase-like oxidoreductase|nr:aldo/keto reductase [Kiritimatiellia bacterium]
MIYTKYGKTDMTLSAIGFGGMRFLEPYDSDQCHEMVQYAYSQGINYFDTAPGYCGDQSEIIFGRAFKEMLKIRDEKPFYVATKSGADNPSDLRRNLENSLERMGLDYIDVYQEWCITSMPQYEQRKANGILKELTKFKEEGLIKHVCISSHLPGDGIREVLNDYPFEGVLLGYCAMNFQYRDAGIDAAAKNQQGVVCMNPLAGGLIPEHPELFEFLKKPTDKSVVESALHFLIDDPRINVALLGFSKNKHVDQAIAAMDSYKPLPSGYKDSLRSNLKENFNSICTGCAYCKDCPQDIPIPALMGAYNQFHITKDPMNMLNTLRYHYGISKEKAIEFVDSCIACKKCEKECTQILPIVNRLQEIKKEISKLD